MKPGEINVTRHAVRRELRPERERQGADRELAHRVRRRVRRGDVARHAADQHDAAARLAQLRQARLDGLEHREHVRLELAAVVLDAELLERAHDAEARVRDGHVEAPVMLDRERDGRVEIGALRHVADVRDAPARPPPRARRTAPRVARGGAP